MRLKKKRGKGGLRPVPHETARAATVLIRLATSMTPLISPLRQLPTLLTAAQSALVPPGKYFYEILLNDGNDVIERVIEGTVIVKQPVTWPSPPPENPFEPQVP